MDFIYLYRRSLTYTVQRLVISNICLFLESKKMNANNFQICTNFFLAEMKAE
jgi:hypothetical protein